KSRNEQRKFFHGKVYRMTTMPEPPDAIVPPKAPPPPPPPVFAAPAVPLQVVSVWQPLPPPSIPTPGVIGDAAKAPPPPPPPKLPKTLVDPAPPFPAFEFVVADAPTA